MGRWQTRESFFHDVCESAIGLRHALIRSSTFLECFLDSGASRIREELRKHPAIHQLRQSLKLSSRDLKICRNALSIVALDKAYSLFTAEIEGDEMNGGRYYAFHRIISLLKDLSAWFVFLSTESTILIRMVPIISFARCPLLQSIPVLGCDWIPILLRYDCRKICRNRSTHLGRQSRNLLRIRNPGRGGRRRASAAGEKSHDSRSGTRMSVRSCLVPMICSRASRDPTA